MLNANYKDQLKSLNEISLKIFPELYLTDQKREIQRDGHLKYQIGKNIPFLSWAETDDEVPAGAMGKVYDGEFTYKSKEKPVPVKVKIIQKPDKQDLKTFVFQHSLSEIDILNSINHPCFVKLFAWGFVKEPKMDNQEELKLFFAMEKADQSLFDYIQNSEGDKPYIYLIILYGTIRGLAYIHYRGQKVIHNDIKHANILLANASPNIIHSQSIKFLIPLICDFNVSKKFEIGSNQETSEEGGTDRFMAPERNDGKYNELADVFSFGIVAKDLYDDLQSRRITHELQINNFISLLAQKCINELPNRPTSKQVCKDIETFMENLESSSDSKIQQMLSFYKQYKKFIDDNTPEDSQDFTAFHSAENWSSMSYGKSYDELCRGTNLESILTNGFYHEFGIGIDQDLYQSLFIYSSIITSHPNEIYKSYEHVSRVASKLGLRIKSATSQEEFYHFSSKSSSTSESIQREYKTKLEGYIHSYLREALLLLRRRAKSGDFQSLGRYIIYLTSKYFQTKDSKYKEESKRMFTNYKNIYEESHQKEETNESTNPKSKSKPFQYHPGVLLNISKIYIEDNEYDTALSILRSRLSSNRDFESISPEYIQFINHILYLKAKHQHESQ